MVNFSYDLAVAGIAMLLITSPFAVRLIKFQFSLSWLFLSILYFAIGQRGISCVLLTVFLLYQGVRHQFYKKYNQELVPPNMGKGYYISCYSEFAGRASNDDDYKYMKIMVWIMAFMFGILILLSGKRV